MDPEWMMEAMPSLFGFNNSSTTAVPTLVMYGKGSYSASGASADAPPPTTDSSTSCSNDTSNEPHSRDSDEEVDDDCICAWNTQDNVCPPLLATVATPQKTSPRTRKRRLVETEVVSTPTNSPKTRYGTDETPQQHVRASNKTSSPTASGGPSTYFAKIEPLWVPPSMVLATDDGLVDADEKERKRGVHHPKYMLLFERSGSLVVVVSTANLTCPSSIDATWVQRFPPVHVVSTTKVNATTKTASSSSSSKTPNNHKNNNRWNNMRRDGSDFGHVLANFLQCQSQAAAVVEDDCMLPNAFLQQHAKFGLQELPQRFQFDQSQVHLIATIPGDFGGRHTTQHLGSVSAAVSANSNNNNNNNKHRSFLYGPQRIAGIIHRLSSSSPSLSTLQKQISTNTSTLTTTKPWLPPSLLSNADRLVMQATSIGGKWTRDSLSRVVRSYLGFATTTKTTKMIIENQGMIPLRNVFIIIIIIVVKIF